MHDPNQYFNRELSWLAFNSRVLAQAHEPDSPSLERLRFLSIWGNNLDEFFQVRVAGLKDQIQGGRSSRTPDGLTPAEALRQIRGEVDRQADLVSDVFADIVQNLAEVGVELLVWDELSKRDAKHATAYFERRIFPILTPLAVDHGHPFPYVSNLSLSLAVILRDPTDGNRRFARLKVPDLLGGFLHLPDGDRFIAVEEIVAAHIGQLFPGMNVTETVAFRVTRNADLEIDEDQTGNLMSAVELELRRSRFQRAVRLELGPRAPRYATELLLDELDLTESDIYVTTVPLDLRRLVEIAAIDRPELRSPRHTPVTPAAFRSADDEPPDLFALLRERDLLVHHPYEAFLTTVEELLLQASKDPAVEAIKMALYRTSGHSEIVDNLIRAAEAGKQVAVVVELKARFDEAANIGWARRLESAGVHVAHGLVGLKVHTKTLLIVRNEPDGIRRYCHIGTGNYNSLTARHYTDLGLFTSNKRIGNDLSQLFNSLTGYGRDLKYRRLVVAPVGLRMRLRELIRREVEFGSDGAITMKMNGLVDADLIDQLYAASQEGVRIQLIVRGICCLRPGVKGLSETISVRSIVGRFLEHSRIIRCENGNGRGEPAYLVGSADLMPRNLDRRVEVMVPVEAPELQARLDEVLEVQLADRDLAWELDQSGHWTRIGSDATTNSQQILADRAHIHS